MIDGTEKLELDDDLDRRVKQLADRQRRSPQRVLEDAVTEYVNRAELRASFRQDALDADRHFAETGLHLNAENLDAWLDSWGEADQSGAPACHI